MVAVIRGRSRAIGLALLLAASLPPTFAQPVDIPDGATRQGFELSVVQGEAVITSGQSSTTPLKFIEGNRSQQYYVKFPVYNSGLEASPANLPVYYWFEENTTAMERGASVFLVRCVSLPAVPAGDATAKGSIPFGFSFTPPTDHRRDPEATDGVSGEWQNDYTMRILVNRVPVGLAAYHHRTPSCNSPVYEAPGPLASSPAANDPDARNNMIVAYFVKDARLDLQVADVLWCRGTAHEALGYNVSANAYTFPERVCDRDAMEDNSLNIRNFSSDMSGPGAMSYNETRKVEEYECELAEEDCTRYDVSNATYFEVRVRNAANATWTGTRDLGGACTSPNHVSQDSGKWYNVTYQPENCPRFSYGVDVRIANLTENVRASNIKLGNSSAPARGWGEYDAEGEWVGPVARSVTWDVINWTGPFRVYATVNDNGFPEVVSTNNDRIHPPLAAPPAGEEAPLPFEVAWTDFEPEFVVSDLKTTAQDPYAYPHQGSVTIGGHILLRNHGPGTPTTFWTVGDSKKVEFANKTIVWRVELDNDLANESGSSSSPGSTAYSMPVWTDEFTFERSTTESDAKYIAPGKHALCVTLDVGDRARETNESNNKKCVDIYLADDSAPSFLPIESRTNPRLTDTPAYNGTALTTVFPGDPIFVHSNVTDDDLSNLGVTAQFTLNSNTSIVRNYTMVRNPAFQSGTFSVRILNFTFTSPNGTTENWTLRTVARDAFGNNATSPPTTFQLKRWPVQTVNESIVLRGIPNGTGGHHPNDSTFDYADPGAIYYELEVHPNQTGFDNQYHYIENFGIRFFTPKNTTIYANGSTFTNLTRCTDDNSQILRPAPGFCENVGLFHSPLVPKQDGGPGRWFIQIEVKDIGGDVRVINRTLTLRDALPMLWDGALNATELEAGRPLGVKVNMTDDFGVDVDNGGARVNFTRKGDNKTFSVPLSGRPASVEGGRATYAFNATIETGYGKPLDEAGEYDVRFAARDTQGNWNTTPPIPFKLNDTRAPDLHEAAVDQPLQEVGQNVTWTARVTDQTNVTVKLRVRPSGSDEDTLRVNLTPVENAGQNFTYTANITREGNYVWEIHALDSAGLTSSVKSGPLSIADNLGPRFQVVEPGVLVAGKRYGRAAPLISIIVSDTHGVDRESINLSVGGREVPHDAPVAAPGGLNGFVVNYTVPAAERYRHGDVVTVNVTALDLSARELRGFLNFTFTVDDVAPTARVRDFTPRYPTEGAGVVNVSLKTRFALEASDTGDPASGVESIRYRVISSLNTVGVENVYNDEPFTIADVPGAYTGPKLYQIQYWAVDEVGNVKMASGRPSYDTLNVYVDAVGPALDIFDTLPEGRFVNATIIDERSGVDRAIVWYSVNGAPYTALPMDFVSGKWKAVLPEGRRDDRVAYYIEAFDRVENRETFGNATEPYSTYTVGNHNPEVRITAPVEGSRVARSVDITWTATDEDGDPLVFAVFMKAPGSASFTELAKLENSDARKFTVNTQTLLDGQYTFRVTVTDGSRSGSASTTVSVLNRGTAFGAVTPPPAEVEAGTPVVLQVEVTKAGAQVEARVFRNGELVSAYPMNDEGRDGDAVANDGKYSARVLMDDGGTYKVEFHARYQEDGVEKTAEIAGGEFVVDDGPLGLGVWLVLLGLVIVAGLAVAAVVILRGRRT